MIINKHLLRLVIFILGVFLFMTAAAAAQTVKKIVVLPFEVHSRDQGDRIQASLLNQLTEALKKEQQLAVVDPGPYRLNKKRMDAQEALKAGLALGVDYVVTGSATQFGETLNIDIRLTDVKAASEMPPLSVAGNAAGLEQLTVQMKREILSRTGLVHTIARVEIAGNRKIGAAAITEQIKSKPGRIFSEADVTADIRTIFKMGFFLDVTASVSDEAAGKVITFTVGEKGLISEIRIIGNKALSQSDILDAMTVKTRQSLNPEQLKTDIQQIKALYDTKGYYNAEITDQIERDGEKDFRVVLTITENDRVYIRTITFEGNEAYTNKELVKMMGTSQRTLLGFITDTGVLKRDQLRQDVQKITAFYFNNGYINAQIGEPQITYDAKGIHIRVSIREGKRFKVGKVAISGDPLEKTRESLLSQLKTSSGNHYDREALMKDLELLTQTAQDEGYANADVNPRIHTKEKEQLVDVDFQISKGRPIHIARIGISGNTITRDKVIRRQLSIVEGDLYSSTKLKYSYERLNQLRYFEEVDIQTDNAADDKMDVSIRVKEKNTGMFMVGAGYSAVDQAIIMAQVVQQNFLGYGQILSLKASLGSKTNNYELSFTEPFLFDLPLWTKADIWKYKKEYDSYTLDTRGGGLTVGYPLVERINGYVGYRLSMDNIQDVNQQTATQYIKDQAGERTISSLTFTLARDTTNDSMFPSKGTKSSVSIQQAGGPLGGNAHFTKYITSVSAFYPLFWDVVFNARGRIGFLQNNDDDDDKIPIYERFVLGGITSLRGLRYVGPTNPGTGDVIGGTRMMNVSAELIFPFIRDAGMKGVVFYDAGNAWNSGIHLNDLRQTAGVGLRWYSPIGPLRLEYGWVIDRGNLQDDATGRWEFTIGMFM